MSERQFLTGAEKCRYEHLHKEKPKKYYTTDYAYMGNTKIRVFAANGKEEFEKIVNDYNVEGYCKCLEDMGYVAKNEEE